MSVSRRLVTVAATCALLVTGCSLPGLSTSSGPGAKTGQSAGASSAGASSPAAKISRRAGESVDVAEFSKEIKASQEKITITTSEIITETNGVTTKQTKVTDTRDKSRPKAKIDSEVAGKKQQIIIIGSTVYAKKEGDAKWTKTTDNDDFNNSELLSKITFSKVTYVGLETMDGEQLQHYATEMSMFGITGPADVWLDSQSRVRRSSSALSGTKITIKMSNFNKPVTITEPPASEVQ